MQKTPFRITIIVLTIIFSALPLFAAGTTETAPTPQADTSSKVVIDSFGREVAIPENVERIACLYAFTGHVTAMLGRGEDIVAVVPGLKRDRILNQITPSLSEASATTLDGVVNIEELLRTKPDLIFLKGETGRMEAEVEKLERFDLTYIVIEYNTIKEQIRAIEIISEALGREDEGEAYCSYYRDTIEQTKELLKDLPAEERVRVYHSVNEAVRTDAPGTLPAEWLEIAGIDNVSLSTPLKFRDNKYFASLEQIYIWDPEVILANESGVDKYLLSNEKWAGLKAVKAGRVYQIPIGISRWGHPGGMETPLAILWTVKKLYPEYSEDLDLDEEVRTFYERFFDLSLSDDMLSSIYQGEEMRIPKGEEF